SRILSPISGTIAANGSALVQSADILYWYQSDHNIELAQSSSNWQERDTVLRPGPRGSFDELGVADPYVIRAADHFYMYYLGTDRARRQRLGVARSHDGANWEKLRGNPILELGSPGAFDEVGLGEPSVWSSGGSWWMLYTGRDRAEHRKIGLAKSPDGVHWQRDLKFPPI